MQNNNIFVFMTLMYNHEKYIIEHLESIKFLVELYGEKYKVDLYINDDASTDNSILLVEKWLSVNSEIFRNVKRFYNTKNVGTCKSICNMLRLASDDATFKLTGGDDIYSFENIFEVCEDNDSYSILSGIPLHFSDADLYLDKTEVLGLLASQAIYKNKPLIERFKFLSINNAPNIFYNTRLLTSDKTLSFLKRFDVVEDWPIQIAIAEQIIKQPYMLKNKVYVYYRRTQGSTYIVANRRFIDDKTKIYNYLESRSNNLLDKILIRNRRFLFILNNTRLNKLLNIGFYIFLIKSLLNYRSINSLKNQCTIEIEDHNAHLNKIIQRSCEFFRDEIRK
ncbi:hypothetical protein VCSRO133_2820 [Vibrio cholerae]|uniref:glycosyltransferase n=1 Tax=Vibrio cholerae TaxID=666 RepID=UPI0011D7550C|nr:glycosyltransferase [Vibrio cholerae]TXY01608.1 glycosyltransferase [Vibrio cholerae]GIA73274.1 hypothetical protein VCSRO133_2820 [Vibrio cholerae]